MFSDSSAADAPLADRIDAMSAALVARSLEYMPRDEFWHERYAERAARFAREDGAFHVRYLVDALRAGSPTVVAEYGKWLRDLLVPRGMCTLHLIEHFENLFRALEAEADTAPALLYVQAGIDALAYGETPAGAIQRGADAIEREVPSLQASAEGTRNSAWETRYLCHYAADAIARANQELLTRHITWSRDLYSRRHGSASAYDDWLSAVAAALGRTDVPREWFAPRELRA
jgi:hypothetical protein